MNTLRSLHRWLGVLALIVFLLTGAYLRFEAHPDELPDGAHLMFVSRHIYILANALVHLALGAYLTTLTGRVGRSTQRVGSSLLLISSVLLITAFVVEPIAGRMRTPVSTWGLYSLFAGVLLHFVAATICGRARRVEEER